MDPNANTGRPKAANTPADANAPAVNSYTVSPGCTVGGKGPGETIELDDNDAKRFCDLGFILDKEGQRRYMSDGPAVNKEDGVVIQPKD